MSSQIKIRRDTAANWTSANPTLASGELGLETDTRKLKIGDGSSAWSVLGYFPAPTLSETAAQTADYTLALTDAGQIVLMSKTAAANLTVPTNASVAFPIGTTVGVYNTSANAVTVAGAGGVTVRNAGTIGQYKEASLRKRGTDEWVMVGG